MTGPENTQVNKYSPPLGQLTVSLGSQHLNSGDEGRGMGMGGLEGVNGVKREHM